MSEIEFQMPWIQIFDRLAGTILIKYRFNNQEEYYYIYWF